MDKPIVDHRILKPKHLRIIVPVIGLILLGVFIWLRNPSSTYRVDRNQLILSEVVRAPFLDYIRVNATVVPGTVITVEALEGGRVEKVLTEEGMRVKRGDVLLVLRNEQLNMSFADSHSSYEFLTNELNDQLIQMKQQDLSDIQSIMVEDNQLYELKRKLEKTTRLHDIGGVSDEEYLALKNNYETSLKTKEISVKKRALDAEWRANKRRYIDLKMQQVRQQLENLRVKAPADGLLAKFNPEMGQSISKGQAVGQIQVLTSCKLTGSIDEYYVDRVQKGLATTLERDGKKHALTVSKVYPQVSEGKFKVDFQFSGSQSAVWRIGQNYALSLQLGETTETIQIERGSFFQSTGGQWVYVLTPDGKAAVKRNIRIGKQNPNRYEVLEGLTPGESVIVSGYESFGDNEKLIFE